jgi:hypothetical protein
VWYEYLWGNNPVRAARRGQLCRVLVRGTRNSVLVEFADGFRMVTSAKALRTVTHTRRNDD